MTLPASHSKGERKERTALLQTAYFGPIQWYQKLHRYDHCLIEQYDSFQKQTYRNRCVIATANGVQALTVPVITQHPSPNTQHPTPNTQHTLTKDIRISDHNQWRRVHWNALQSAYSESPFFEYYADDLHPFFEKHYEFLLDFNEAIRQKICELIDIHPHVVHSSQFIVHNYEPQPAQNNYELCTMNYELCTMNYELCTMNYELIADFREVINAKHPLPDAEFGAKPYWQVFQHKHGFLPNLSILDLLFNMGPESIFYL